MDNKSAEVLEHLRMQLQDFELIHFTVYKSWTPRSIYTVVLKSMKVAEEKIKELCGLIPSEAKIFNVAVWISTEFSCLSRDDYIYSLAVEIGNTLINTFKEEGPQRHHYALIPKGIAVPVVLDIYVKHNDRVMELEIEFIFELTLSFMKHFVRLSIS